jgi:hypothetical protein
MNLKKELHHCYSSLDGRKDAVLRNPNANIGGGGVNHYFTVSYNKSRIFLFQRLRVFISLIYTVKTYIPLSGLSRPGSKSPHPALFVPLRIFDTETDRYFYSTSNSTKFF